MSAALSRLRRNGLAESKWTIDANGNWVQRPMIRKRVGSGQVETPVNEEAK